MILTYLECALQDEEFEYFWGSVRPSVQNLKILHAVKRHPTREKSLSRSWSTYTLIEAFSGLSTVSPTAPSLTCLKLNLDFFLNINLPSKKRGIKCCYYFRQIQRLPTWPKRLRVCQLGSLPCTDWKRWRERGSAVSLLSTSRRVALCSERLHNCWCRILLPPVFLPRIKLKPL